MALSSVIFKLVIAFLILVVGFGLMKLMSRLLIKVRRATVKDSLQKKSFTAVFEKVSMAVVLAAALVWLGFESFSSYFVTILDSAPNLLMIILFVVLGVLVIQLLSWLMQKMMSYTRLQEIVSEELSSNIIPVMLIFIKIILYMILFEITVSLIQIPIVTTIANFILYPAIILVFLLVFTAMINPVRDFGSGFYLRNMWRFKPGNKIKFNKGTFVIKNISRFSTELVTDKGSFVVVPNRVLAGKGIEFEKPSREIQTLEDIKEKFVAQLPSMCGPAAAQIALAIFDIKVDQQELAKLMGTIVREREDQVAGTHPRSLIKAVEKASNKKVIGTWVDSDKIYNLKKEAQAWLGEGAILIADYKKKFLFPTALRAHYSLIVGVRGDEFLMVDPSGKKGGVYFSDYRDVLIGMDTYSELIQAKRGYIVLAPKGSAGYHRISEGLIYFHPSMYDKVNKSLELKLHRITSGPALAEMMPNFLKNYLKKFEREQVSRVWKP